MVPMLRRQAAEYHDKNKAMKVEAIAERERVRHLFFQVK